MHVMRATWDRQPVITAGIEQRLYACIAAKCGEMRGSLVEIGGTEDHVHVIVRLWATISVAKLVHGLKGASSHLASHVLAPGAGFKWQGTYFAESVSLRHLDNLRRYVRN